MKNVVVLDLLKFFKVKVKLSLCFKWAPRHEGVLWNGSVAPRIDLSTKWRWVVIFTPRPLYPQWKSSWYPLYRMLDGSQSQYAHSGVAEIKLTVFTEPWLTWGVVTKTNSVVHDMNQVHYWCYASDCSTSKITLCSIINVEGHGSVYSALWFFTILLSVQKDWVVENNFFYKCANIFLLKN